MNKNKLYIILATLAIILIGAIMLMDFFSSENNTDKNVYEYNIDEFTDIDPELVTYFESMKFPAELNKLKGVAVDKNDNIYISGDNLIKIFSASGNQLGSIPVNGEPGPLYVADSIIYLASGNNVKLYSTDGNPISQWAPLSENSILSSITRIGTNIYVADAGTKMVYIYSEDGEIISVIGEKDPESGFKGFIIPSACFDIATGRDDELWVVNPGRHMLMSYKKDGTFISSWKKTSMELDGFSGCCNPTNICILDDGDFVTSEKGIVRIKIHSPNGKFKTVVATPDDFEKGTTGLDMAVDSKERIIILDPVREQVRIFEKK